MDMKIDLATPDDLPEIARLYDELNDYLSANINYPGWIKGIYPTRQHAETDIADGTLYVARLEGKIVGSIVLNGEPEKDPQTTARGWSTRRIMRY